MTFYGWPDNSPPGGAIAYPKNGGFPTVHNVAGGTGTYANPIHLRDRPGGATGRDAAVRSGHREVPGDGRRLRRVRHRLVFDSQKWHVDVWMNSNGTAADSNAVLGCEDQWTTSTTVVEINPPPGRPATAPPLFDTTTNVCRTSP